MANAEHLEILKSGVEKWNEWRINNKEIKPNLSNANLSNTSLAYFDLSEVDLSEADLSKADINRAFLRKVDLSEAYLSHANLREANLVDANLQRANLRFSNLIGANLEGATLRNTYLIHAKLGDAKLVNVDLRESDLRNANLYNANLSESDLRFAKLSDANLCGANLQDSDLRYTAMDNVNLFSANLEGVNLFNANLTGATLNEAILYATNLTQTRLNGAKFKNAKIGRTIFCLTELSNCEDLETVDVFFPCPIDFQTIRVSKNLPKSFLLKIGLPELYIDYLPEFYGATINFFPAFLSYSSANKDFTWKLYESLIAKGINVFFDEKKMKPGDEIYESLSRGIEHYDKMILVCSKESLSESWWVDRELDRVLAKERHLQKERRKRINLLIPITIDDYVFSWDGAKGEEVLRYVIGDFREWQNDAKFEKALNGLIHALNVDRPDIKPPSFL